MAVAVWMILAARSVASIPFVRTQLARRRDPATSVGMTDVVQLLAVAVAIAALIVDVDVLVGAATLVVVAAAQAGWMRREVPAVKVLGITQMALGFAVVAATAAGVLIAA